ncbi:NADH-ubiquinone oxidoreductase-F iron-sulfur binding region domain-containing protein [Streptacidiphilus sp. EB129]|uniref:NADH-ubiquinone oxidoreductase-F iron-sulfur binding region domain-containing protein n=1 Tax=Streptacidiphilus sp. EB129 TaxID=3156262 RepID=UPI003512E914
MTTIRTPTGDPSPVLGPNPQTVESLDGYLAAGGYRPCPDTGALLDRVAAADLRGRGGAGFPAATKLRSVRDRGGTPVVVANGEEGEPGSAKDRWLMRARPHLVLDGLALAAAITGADRGYVYLSDAVAAERIRQALAERDPGLPVSVLRTEHAYVAGEETAVVRRIDGGPALPTAKPPRPFERGVGGAPTLVANVETLARLALLSRYRDGAATTALVTLSGGPRHPLLTEVRYGTPLRTLAELHGVPQPRAVLMGGLFGGLLDPDRLELRLDQAELASAGSGLGCGAIRFLDADECPVAITADALELLAAESSRQCGVCVSGTRAMAETLSALATGVCGTEGTANLARWSRGLPGRGACGLLDAAARLAGSLLAHFPELVAAHLRRPCPTCAATPPDSGRRLHVPAPDIAPGAQRLTAIDRPHTTPGARGTARATLSPTSG